MKQYTHNLRYFTTVLDGLNPTIRKTLRPDTGGTLIWTELYRVIYSYPEYIKQEIHETI